MWILFGILGLIIGSFLNVVIVRLKSLETILGRSFCRHCEKKIRWYDNIPLASFLILRGRCRDCKEPFSYQYPLVEGLTGVLFALTAWAFFDIHDMVSIGETFFVLGVIAVSIVIFFYDFRHMEIPMVVLWFGIFWTIMMLLWLDWAVFPTGKVLMSMMQFHLHAGIVGGGLAFLFFFFLATLSKERWMGLGDAYIGLFIGLVLGGVVTFYALTFAFALGATVGVGLLLRKQKTLKSQLPFAPFLLFALVFFIFLEKLYPTWLSTLLTI